jgi:hypothetical protein
MAFSDELKSLTEALERAQVPVEAVLSRTGTHRITWARWTKRSTKAPRYEKWTNFRAVAEAMIQERRAQ